MDAPELPQDDPLGEVAALLLKTGRDSLSFEQVILFP